MNSQFWAIAHICREALNQEIYGGEAPHDSNALTQVWSTETGAAFVIEHQGKPLVVAVGPTEADQLATWPHHG